MPRNASNADRPRLLWMVICEHLIVDRATNKVSFINVSEHLKSPEFPVVIEGLVLASSWAANSQSETMALRLSVSDPNGNKILEFEPPQIEFTRKYERVNIDLQGLHIEAPGIHIFAFDVKQDGVWVRVGEMETCATLS